MNWEDTLNGWETAKSDGKTKRQYAAEIGLTFTQLHKIVTKANGVRRAKEERKGKVNPYNGDRFDHPLPNPWTLSGDWMVIGDLHVPYTDYDLAQHVTAVAERYLERPRRLLIAGDLLNLDTMSIYLQIVPPATWQQERDSARQLFAEWLETFDEIKIIMGNHDRRMQKFVNGAFDENDMLALLTTNEQVMMSNYGWCMIETANGPWRVSHPRNYSVNKLVIADVLAQKYDSHIMSFHEHHLGLGFDRYGRHLIVNGGCLVNPEKLAYVQLDDSKSPAMQPGFCLLRNGHPYLFGDGLTDWKMWL